MSQVHAGTEIIAYEGLVLRTATLFHRVVGLEVEDMRQELWLKVVKARRAYDPTRSSMTERSYVYALLANLVKDLKRDAARRANAPLHVTHIEEYCDLDEFGEFQWFEHRYSMASHDEVYGQIEDGFVMPATVTPQEQEVLLLLVLGYDQTEIARELAVERWLVVKLTRQLREKFADWREPSAPVALPTPAPARGQAVAA